MRKDWTWPTEALAGVVSGLELLDPKVSQDLRDDWWQTFLPGLSASGPLYSFIFDFAKKVQVKIALKAEVHYSRQQQGGVFYVVSEPLLPVLRFEAASPPPLNILKAMLWESPRHGAPEWCAICPDSMDWSMVVEHDGPYFLKPAPCMDPPLGDSL
ncbi:hypothetical protein [Corallococcus sp. AS-1-6]|uniref:hypothetical protein n=1 Tax=Corallococcus sp. AS-1-6 TaxID=2874599 RepID=UPI001CC0E292|nr:hypothetical protein [Corallococcus sp. AS-1-6]MBZ4373336.1 hypothetical protein [Corallococcus sp. AS-1-6]